MPLKRTATGDDNSGLFGFDCGIAAGGARRGNHRHVASWRWRRDRDAGIDALRRMEHSVGAIELLAQRLPRTAAAAGRGVLRDNLRRRRGRRLLILLLIRGLRAARSGTGQRKPGQYRRNKIHAGEGHDRPPTGFPSERMLVAGGSATTPFAVTRRW